jgi:Protein of unknown function (DUF2889)
MPLSERPPRQAIHHRHISCHGYRCADGRWEIEAFLVDTKTYDFHNEERGQITAGVPLHQMALRLTVNDDFIIEAVEAVTDYAPFRMCPTITPAFQSLCGLSLKKGFLRHARERLGGVQGCTHLVELLGPLATTAFQTLYPILAQERQQRFGDAPPATRAQGQEQGQDSKALGEKPALLGSCHAFSPTSPVVARYWPEFYEGQNPAPP